MRGMTCGNCARAVENETGIHARRDQSGRWTWQAPSAHVEYDTDLVKPEAMANAVRALGYEVPA